MPDYKQSGVFVKHLDTNSKAKMARILLDGNIAPCVAPISQIRRTKA